MDAVAHRILERDGEIARIERGLTRAWEEGGVVLVEGPAGIGKSALLGVAIERAGSLDVNVMVARGTEIEQDLPFALARQLLEPAVTALDAERRGSLLRGAASLAAPLVAPSAPSDSTSLGDRSSLFHGLFWLCSGLAASRPLLLCVDDVHLGDAPTLGWLEYLLARLTGEPIALLLAAREGEPVAPEGALERIASGERTEVVKPRALSAEASAELVRAHYAGSVADEFCAACHRASGGNPFLLTELVEALLADGVEPSTAGAERVRRLGPVRIARTTVARLSRLPAGSLKLAHALAVLERSTLGLAAAVAEMDERSATEAADALLAAGIVTGPDPWAFSHPVVREAVHVAMSPGQRSRLHARAAAELIEAGLGPGRAVSHLLASEPAGVTGAVESLRAAATVAAERGDQGTAVTFLRRAIAEPVAAERRAELLAELGAVEARLGLPEAVEHLNAARAQLAGTPLEVAAGVDLVRALLFLGRWPEAQEQFLPLEELNDQEERAVLAELAGMSRPNPQMRERSLEVLRRLADRDPPDLAAAMALGSLAHEAAATGGTAEQAAALAERALSDPALRAGRPESPSRIAAVTALLGAGRRERLLECHAELLDDAASHGSAAAFSFASVMGSMIQRRLGTLREAEAHLDAAASALAPETIVNPGYYSELMLLCLERGDSAGAEEALAASAMPEEIPDNALTNQLLEARGHLRIATAREREGVEDLLEFGRRFASLGIGSPVIGAWRSEAALALSRLGERDEARRLAREELSIARAFGAPREVGVALRATALLDEDRDAGIETLRLAVEQLERAGARLDRAKALADLGAALRRSGRRREAREPLKLALDIAARDGASVVGERCRVELRAAGARPRRPLLTGAASLTPSERRVCEMAARGMTNRMIAESLFVTLNTVETHLSRAYLKLGISSRSELREALRE
jgi:DNA-binding CsgD family transcriptional regulator